MVITKEYAIEVFEKISFIQGLINSGKFGCTRDEIYNQCANSIDGYNIIKSEFATDYARVAYYRLEAFIECNFIEPAFDNDYSDDNEKAKFVEELHEECTNLYKYFINQNTNKPLTTERFGF